MFFRPYRNQGTYTSAVTLSGFIVGTASAIRQSSIYPATEGSVEGRTLALAPLVGAWFPTLVGTSTQA